MESSARLIKNWKYSRQILTDEQILQGLWPGAVGKAIARHTCKLKVVRETLVVEVEDAIWQRQLFPLSSQIVRRIQQLMGNDAIERIEFRVGIPKRQMQREEETSVRPDQQAPGSCPDEAEQILDPVLKKLYRLSRKRASA
jgi:hypothetical protein